MKKNEMKIILLIICIISIFMLVTEGYMCGAMSFLHKIAFGVIGTVSGLFYGKDF